MNKRRITKLIVFFVCLFSVNIYGQRKEITREELLEAYTKAVEKTRKLSRRIISESKVYGDDETKIVQTQKSLDEFALPNSSRFIVEAKRTGIDKVSSFEIIRIGDVEYKREENGKWTKRDYEPMPEPVAKSLESKTKYYLTENAKLNDQTADLYELEIEFKHQNRNPVTKEVFENTTLRKEKRWISKDGLLLKIEIVDEKINPRKIIFSRVSVYEYDPNIKIEAPMIESETKQNPE